MDNVSERLSRTGCGETALPLLVLWGARALYLGPAFGLSAHRNAVAVVAIGIDAPFEVARDPRNPETGYRSTWTAIIGPNTLHLLRTSPAPIAFIYLDPLGSDLNELLTLARDRDHHCAYDLANEAALIDHLRAIADGNLSWPEARVSLTALLRLHVPARPDARIVATMQRLQDAPAMRCDVSGLADEAGLSSSRYLHLFKQTSGVPFRRYRIWCRFAAATRLVKAGASLTEAAHAAGFASSAHFSAAFREMFGLSPTGLGLNRLSLIDGN